MKSLEKIAEASIMLGAGLTGPLAVFYQGAGKAFLHSYAHDAALPVVGYFAATLAYGSRKIENALAAAGFCAAGEAAQALGWYHGTFDPRDFVAYAAGAGIALGLDALLDKTLRAEDSKTLKTSS